MRPTAASAWRAARPRLGAVRRRANAEIDRRRPSGPPSSPTAPDTASRARADFYLGLALHAVGRSEAAVEHLRRSCEADPRFVRRWRRLGLTALEAGDVDTARRAIGTALESAPTDLTTAVLHVALARVDPATGPIDVEHLRAEVLADALAEIDRSDDPTGLFWAGLVADADDDPETALRRYRRSIELDDADPMRLRTLASLEARLGNAVEAARLHEAADAAESRRAAHLGADRSAPATADAHPDESEPERAARLSGIVLTRDVVDDEHASANDLRALAAAAGAAGEHELACTALQRLRTLDPTDPGLFDRLADQAARAGDVATEVEARERATLLEPTATRFHRLGVSLTRAGRHDEAVVMNDRAMRLAGTDPVWLDRFGKARRSVGDEAGAASVYRVAVERFPDDALLRFQLGFQAQRLDEYGESEQAYRAALALEPERAEWWFRLGHVLEHGGEPRTTELNRVGLVVRPVGAPDRSAAAYRRSLELEPDDLRTLLRLGGVEEQRGRFDEAIRCYERATDVAPDDANAWTRLGRGIAAAANQRGIYHASEHDRLEAVWGRAIELAPRTMSVRNQLARSSIKAGRWAVASDVTWYPPPDRRPGWHDDLRRAMRDDTAIDAAEQALDRPVDELLTVPRDWWFSLHWRLLAANRFTSAYRAKLAMASHMVEHEHGSLIGDPAGLMERARSLLVCGRPDDALDLMTPSLTASLPDTLRHQLARHAADLQLLAGDVEPHIAALAVHAGAGLAGSEEAFDALIRGRRVAIVGPGLSDLEHGDEIDGHDVVIRTKFVADQLDDYAAHAGRRTDISYYALGSARFLRDEIQSALTSGELRMAVFRTATFVEEPASISRPGDLRYVPSEYQMSLRASQFAIQRIIHDIVRYRPESIKVFNIDFFLSPHAYRPGYVRDYHRDHIERGYIQVLGSFGHDYLADFVFTKAMRHHGIVTVDENIGRILDLEPDEYLRRLDRSERIAPSDGNSTSHRLP